MHQISAQPNPNKCCEKDLSGTPHLFEQTHPVASSNQPVVDTIAVLEIFNQLKAVTLSNQDSYGNKIQLWRTKKHGLLVQF